MESNEGNGGATPRPGVDSSSRHASLPDLYLTFSPTSEPEVAHALPATVSTTDMDAFRTSYFASDNSQAGLRPRSMSNPDPSAFLPVEESQNSRMADVSEAETAEVRNTLDRSRTQARGTTRKRKVGRTTSARVMSRGEDELAPDWTVFGELFAGQQAPIINENASGGSTKRSTTTAGSSTVTGSGVARTTSSVILHWKSIINNSRQIRANADEERTEPVASSSSTQPVDILARARSSRVPNTATVGSPVTTISPKTNAIPEELSSPMVPVLDGQEDNLAHHRLSTDYDRASQKARKQTRHTTSSSDSDSDTESEVETPHEESRPRFYSKPMYLIRRWREEIPSLSTLHRNMIKCAIAYFLSSLFTFVPFLSSLISDITTFGKGGGAPSPSAHMIATISVYFNPAKTAGGMFEADVFCVMGVLFSTLVTGGSWLSSWIIEEDPELEWLGDFIIVFWIGLAMMIVSWLKVWINKASFNTAASMTSIIMFVVVVKEGGFPTLGQVVVNVIIGALIANFVCFILWPQSATANLQRDMITSLESYATLLDMLTSSFLLDPRSKGRSQIMRAVEAHQASFTSLKRNLDEARSEWVLDPPDAPKSKKFSRKMGLSELYEDAVDSLNRLAQHLAGLRSGTKLQKDLTMAYGKKAAHQGQTEPGSHPGNNIVSPVADESDERKDVDEEAAALASAAAVFGDLVDDVGPPMVALTDACTNTLKGMRKVLIQDRQRSKRIMSWLGYEPLEDRHDFSELSSRIERALFLFDSTSNRALMNVYRKSANTDAVSLVSTLDGYQDENETIFLVYFFIFTLQEFARELVSLVEVMGQLHEAQENALAYRGFLGWWRRILGLRRRKDPVRSLESHHSGSQYGANGVLVAARNRPALRKRFTNLVPIDPSNSLHSAFPRTRAHAPNTTQTPARASLSFIGRIQQRLWAFLNKLKDGDFRYSLKVGVSIAILSAPAFIDATRPIFVEYRGEWALISCFVVMGQTIGATNFLAVHRILGTLFGAGVATLAFVSLSPYPVLLALFGFVFSIPCFYYIVGKPEYATTGRFVLLSYNLTALFCYNAREQHLSIYEIAIHRSISVTAGVVWALIISRMWWPSEARRELGVGLSDFLLNLGWLYNRLVMTYSVPPETFAHQAAINHPGITLPILGSTAALVDGYTGGPDERTGLLGAALTSGLNSNIREFMSMELHLQIKLISLQKLLSQAHHEPRLKGPFPVQLYRSILLSLQMILDLFHSMRCVTTREEWYTNVRREFVVPVNRQRREMVGNVILYFSVLSSAFQLKKPLPPYLPPAERSRQHLVDALRSLTIVKERKVQSSRQLLYFAYALMMKGVIAELEILGHGLQQAFGVIGQTTEEFESLFRP